MAAKLIAFDEEARSKLLTGVLKLSKAVKATLGQRADMWYWKGSLVHRLLPMMV